MIRERNALLVALVMMVGAAGRGTGALGTYLTTFVVDRYGVNVSFAAAFFAAYMLGGVVGPITMGWFADRTSPRLALRITLVFSAIFALLFLMPKTPGFALGAATFLAGFFIHSRGSLTQSMVIWSRLERCSCRYPAQYVPHHVSSQLTRLGLPYWGACRSFWDCRSHYGHGRLLCLGHSHPYLC